MRHFTCDMTGEKLTGPETTILRVTGPLASMTDRREFHLGKQAAREIGRLLGHTILEPLDQGDPDADATSKDLAADLVVKASKPKRK